MYGVKRVQIAKGIENTAATRQKFILFRKYGDDKVPTKVKRVANETMFPINESE
tara:strand:- start:85 stop:246 length:162 start_codon:yes stop_codon:yes gene_type:complete